MALIRGWRFLDSARINRIVRTLADELESIGSRRLIALARTPVVNADDAEIVGKFKGQFVAADVIADDQMAAVYDTVGQFEFVTTEIPNLKMGSRVTQHMINRLSRLRQNISGANDVRFFTDWENTLAESLVLGVRQRMNALICAMWLDAADYDRYGIKLANASWGTPSQLKVNASTDWADDNTANATPITDLLTLANTVAPDTFGETYNRITMSSQAFRYMIKTTEYQNLVSGELRYSFGAGQMNMQDFGAHRQMVANLLGMELEIHDGVFYEVANNGVRSQVRYIPSDKIILSNTNDDNDANAMDFANGTVTESIVAPLIGHGGGISGESFGPIAYFTGNENLNPPDIVAWAVARGFPRKHRETATAVYTATDLGLPTGS